MAGPLPGEETWYCPTVNGRASFSLALPFTFRVCCVVLCCGRSPEALTPPQSRENDRRQMMMGRFLFFARGLAPRTVRTQQSELSSADKKQLLEKGVTADRDGMDTERVSGLGAGP